MTDGYDRRGLRYASDCTDAEWPLIRPFRRTRANDGNLPGPVLHTAAIQDRHGAADAIKMALASHPAPGHIFADGGCAGDKPGDAMAEIEGRTIEIVRRPPGITGFVGLARRWPVASIRVAQADFSTRLRFAFTSAFAISMGLRMMAAIATFAGFPASRRGLRPPRVNDLPFHWPGALPEQGRSGNWNCTPHETRPRYHT